MTISGVAAGGDGLSREEAGRVVFVEGAIPGDRVRVDIVESKRDFARGRVSEILEPAPERVAPPCPAVAAGCGGCQWQHASIEAQMSYKRTIVVDSLRRLAHLPDAPVDADVAAVPATAYRTTVRAGVDGDRAAYRRRHSHELVTIGECLVTHPLVVEVLRDGRFPGAREVTVRASVATGERLVLVRPGRAPVHVPDGVTIVPDDARPARGNRGAHRPGLTESVAGRMWRVSAHSFFQPGPTAAELLVAAVRDLAGEDARTADCIVDLYAGVGLLGGCLAGPATRLVVVESSRDAAADARHNLADVDAVVHAMLVERWRSVAAGLVVADPSRTGLGRPGTAAVAATGAPVLVLASCDPASFARDTTLLAGRGYRLARTRVLDLFPHTTHVETVSRFERP